jgi:hypothetical protein
VAALHFGGWKIKAFMQFSSGPEGKKVEKAKISGKNL